MTEKQADETNDFAAGGPLRLSPEEFDAKVAHWRAALGLKDEMARAAVEGAGRVAVGRPASERVDEYPSVIASHYLAAGEADDNATLIARAMGSIERWHRDELRALEGAGHFAATHGKLNDEKRCDILAQRHERDADYQVLQSLYDASASAKRNLLIEGDRHRRDYYNAREVLWAALRAGVGANAAASSPPTSPA